MDEEALKIRLVKCQEETELLKKKIVKDLDKLTGLLNETIKIKNILKIE